MTEAEKNALGKKLWNIANTLRGGMNADDFRDSMLSFLFLRYLSDQYVERARVVLGRDYEAAAEKAAYDGKRQLSPLSVWQRENPDAVKDFETMMRRQIGYVIQPEYLWDNIVSLAKSQDDGLLRTLEEAFKYIETRAFEEEGAEGSFSGLFSEIHLSSDKLGKDYTERNRKLQEIIRQIADGLSEFHRERDALGDAYEYLIGQFAAGSGKKAGEFYTPQRISDILSGIVTLDSQNPTTGIRPKLDKVLDFACGSGSLLLNIRHRMEENKGHVDVLFGQEKNITTYNLARMNMLLHGVRPGQFEIFHGDTLLNQWERFQETHPTRMEKFDAVVANPPFSLRWTPPDTMAEDLRFKNYAVAPKSAADMAFLLHGFHHLADDGTMAIILPHGVLFRGGAEARIRQKLLVDGNIDAVIGLPSNLFYSTGILVLKKCAPFSDVLFINAAELFEKGKNQNHLTPEHTRKIIDAYRNRKEEPRFSRRVPRADIEANDFNLNISRYVSTAEEEAEIALQDVDGRLRQDARGLKEALHQTNEYLAGLSLVPLP